MNNMVNIIQIIEIYDNGHERIFYPKTHIIVKKKEIENIYRKLSRSIHAHTTLDNLESLVIDTLKDLTKYFLKKE